MGLPLRGKPIRQLHNKADLAIAISSAGGQLEVHRLSGLHSSLLQVSLINISVYHALLIRLYRPSSIFLLYDPWRAFVE